MEGQSTTQSETTELVPDTPPSSKERNKPLTLLAILVFLLMAGGLVYLGYQNYQLQQKLNGLVAQQASTDIEEQTAESVIPAYKMLLSGALSQYCIEGKIDIDKLPFTLDQTVKTAYQIQNSIDCSVPDENYANMSININTPDFTGNRRSVYFFHQGSKFLGMGDNLRPLSDYNQAVINGQIYAFEVMEPGPYGISTQGVWIRLIKEKKDPESDTIARVFALEIIEDEQFIDLVVKYGTQGTTPDGETIYTIGDPSMKTLFIEEVIALVPQNDNLIEASQNITLDLTGILF
jgi:hypothetical protein